MFLLLLTWQEVQVFTSTTYSVPIRVNNFPLYSFRRNGSCDVELFIFNDSTFALADMIITA